MFVFGGVYVHSTPEQYLKLASDIDALRKLPSYLAIKKFGSDPPQLSDLDGLTLEDEDIKDLQKCREGKCEIQLPADVMDEFHTKINWSAHRRPRPSEPANENPNRSKPQKIQARRQRSARNLSRQKQSRRGRASLSVARKQGESASCLSSRASSLFVELPESEKRHQIRVHWESLLPKATIPVLQAVHRERQQDPARPVNALAVKQLYASHYFQTALDLTICVPIDGAHNQPGMFLITLKRLATSRTDRIERQHRQKSCRRQNSLFARAGARRDENHSGITGETMSEASSAEPRP